MRVKSGVLVGALLSLLTAVTVANPASAAVDQRSDQWMPRDSASVALQSEVDRDLATLGGKQVAANRIVAGDGSVITYVPPGEKYAHVLGDGLDGNNPQTAKASCAYGAFCGWSKSNFTGRMRSWVDCNVYFTLPSTYSSGGSWINNQTHHYTTSMYDKYGSRVYTTPPAYSSDDHGDWSNIHFIYNDC